ncbi:hypothetical protein SELMODRAFT_105669 [Selaginella moellendorffii]|uniref:lipoyl(octanoyl) transferase n=1 Tax=Selaginella moellendorffii TaxID=88036 RepID=D8S059_SELML|nr:octanoyltransferase [Selaginella moellendorffii]EFJ22419.1 hypothetical protein SELMODRAFT_105669 [Selaginella moellendorffii]|eukprot:XP_002976750.1 octanoyltransferase [Selaginella moellendorffii]
MRTLQVLRAGTIPYNRALALQRNLHEQRRSGGIDDTLVLAQHPPTITLGRHTLSRHSLSDAILTPQSELQRLQIEVHQTHRGGDATFHGPGQPILYPIVSLRALGIGIRLFVERLEDLMLEVARDYKLQAGRIPSQTGCWIDQRRKIGALGISAPQGVTMHGLAFNANTDLDGFKHIVPCGILDKEVTSLARELGQERVDEKLVEEQLLQSFVRLMGYERVVSTKNLGEGIRTEDVL